MNSAQLFRRGFSQGLLILVILAAFLIWGLASWQKNGSFFGFSPYKTVNLIDLLSYGNLYDGKKVCTRGYYLQADLLSIIKVSLKDDNYTRSAWVLNPTGQEVITQIPGQERIIEATVCGYFASQRAGEFGDPPVWNHQITLEKFQTHGDVLK